LFKKAQSSVKAQKSSTTTGLHRYTIHRAPRSTVIQNAAIYTTHIAVLFQRQFETLVPSLDNEQGENCMFRNDLERRVNM
jgi:hypothetical protein